MKIYRLFADNIDAPTTTLRSYSTIHDSDTRPHNDFQNILAALPRYHTPTAHWLWDDGDYLTFDDGTRLRI